MNPVVSGDRFIRIALMERYMENSRIGSIIMALPLVILVLALVVSLSQVGFDMEAATLPKNPVEPLENTMDSFLKADGPLVAGTAVESGPAAGTVTLTGQVQNPTAYPLAVEHLDYRISGANGNLTASLASPVSIAPHGSATVELTGPATPDTLSALKSGRAEGTLTSVIEIMGIRITTEMVRPWGVGA